MNYRNLSEHLHYLDMMSSTLLLPPCFSCPKTVLENGDMKCEPTLFHMWNNKTVFTLLEHFHSQKHLITAPHAGPAE